MKDIDFMKIRLFFLVTGILLSLWWPLSHLFYSDFYHSLLGFKVGSYQDSMVIMIGICGFLPVMLLLRVAFNPLDSTGILSILSLFSFMLSATYVYLIRKGLFPVPEYFNAFLSLIAGIVFLKNFSYLKKNKISINT